MKDTNHLAFVDWKDAIENANGQIHFTEETFPHPGTFFGTWTPRRSDVHFRAYAGIPLASMKADRNAPVSVLAFLDDTPSSRTDKYEEEWNGFWQFFNVMQFGRQFAVVCGTGLENHVYEALLYGQTGAAAEDSVPSDSSREGWSAIRELLFDKEAVKIADELERNGIPAPEEAGYELADDSGTVIAEMELAWVSRKMGIMTEDQVTDRRKAENAGWRIFTSADEISAVFEEG